MPTFITGACGFVGLALTERLLQDGHQLLAHLEEMWQETRTFLGV